MADEGKEFPCKEPNCDQRVKYEPQEVRGSAQLAKRAPPLR